jgi:hypothetical protein
MSAGVGRKLFGGVEVDLTPIEACAAGVKDDVLKPVASAYRFNAAGLKGLLEIPQFLAENLASVFTSARDLMEASLDMFARLAEAESNETFRALLPRLKAQAAAGQAMLDQLTGRRGGEVLAGDIFDKWGRNERWQAGQRVLLSSATSGAWTAFECVATDAWVAAVNARPMQLWKKAWDAPGAEGQAEGLDGKSVPVGLPAKYGFDLRGHLGDLLKTRFDFTSVSGIEKAYRDTLGVSEAMKRSLDSVTLRGLEVIRNVVVHRGGVVDQAFKDRVRKFEAQEGVEYAVGSPLPLDGRVVSKLVAAALEAGCDLLRFVDDWLADNPG